MASVSETGHAKNSANFRKLIDFAIGFQEKYNPSNPDLAISKLEEQYLGSQKRLKVVADSNTLFNNATNARETVFKGNKSLSTRILNALEASNVSKLKINDAKEFNRKLQGKRAVAIKKVTDPNTPAPLTISVSQQSFDQQIQHFKGFVSLLEEEPKYAPNEADLTAPAIQLHITDMSKNNDAVSTAHVNVSNDRLDRNKFLYDEATGLVDTAKGVKNYIKSVFAANSPQYKLVSGLSFLNKI